MNKPLSSLLLLLSSSFVLAACGETKGDSSIVNASISISQSSLTLEAYETHTLSYSLVGKEGMPTWSSSDPSIASVDQNGLVTALKKGTCTIDVALGDLKDSCSLTVNSISMAPRIVLSDFVATIDKNGSYVVDAYVLYKGEKLIENLTLTPVDEDAANIASLNYENGKIHISGIDYGEANYVVSTTVKGVLITSPLKVKVVNSSLKLSLNNTDIEYIDDAYSLNMNSYSFGEEDEYPTEYTPIVNFTENGEPATYPLTYTSSDDTVASFDETHKIVAKKEGEATLKIVCEKFSAYIAIKVRVYKGAYDVTLVNLSESGATQSLKVAPNKMPTYTPSITGKTFLGWFDEEGDEVTSVDSDCTLIAKWGAVHYNANNKVLFKFSSDDADYSKPAGVTAKYAVTSNTIANLPDGSRKFARSSNAMDSNGIGLPAFDFSEVNGVHFTFGYDAGVWHGIQLNGTGLGQDNGKQNYQNFTVSVIGKNVSGHNAYGDSDFSFVLDDDTYNGKKGLEITVTMNCDANLYITPFVSMDCDYLATAKSIETSLPDTVDSDSAHKAAVSEYSALRDFFTSYENNVYPISQKMKAWLA